MIKLRPSALPLVTLCAASLKSPEIRIESPRGPADLGTAFHACMAAVAGGTQYDGEAIAARNNVDVADLMPLVGWASAIWRNQLAALFPNPLVEAELRYADADMSITGHPDVAAYVPECREVRILDYKSGFADRDAREQLKGYGLLTLAEWPDADQVRVTKWQVRDGRATTEIYTRAQLLNHWDWLKAHAADQDTYRPGKHCGDCRRALECDAHNRQIQSLINTAIDAEAIKTHTAEDLAVAVEFARALGRRLDSFLDSAKAHVAANGGEYGRLFLKEETRKTISFARGRDVLVEAIGEPETMALASIGKTDAEDAVKALAPKGRKGQAADDLIRRLDSVGAITTHTHTKLRVNSHGKPEIQPTATVKAINPNGATAAGTTGE
jgi:hypothetical protein